MPIDLRPRSLYTGAKHRRANSCATYVLDSHASGATMTFDEILAQALDLLQRQGRVSYRVLKRRFALDDDYKT
jgi:hypothetical protein